MMSSRHWGYREPSIQDTWVAYETSTAIIFLLACLSREESASLHFPIRDTSQLEHEKIAHEKSFSSILHFIHMTCRKLYWSLSQNRITLWVRKHNMYDLCSLGKKNPLQSSSFSSVIPFAYNTFLSKRERSPSILPGLVKNSSSSNKTAQILPFGVNVLFFHTPKAFKVWRWLSYGTYQDQGHFIFRLSKHESDWINWLWNNLKGLLELWLCLTSVTTFLVETD